MKSSVILIGDKIKYVVDTWAWIEYLISSRKGERVKKIVENESNEIYTNGIIIAELISKTSRENMDVKTAFEALTGISKVFEISEPNFSKEVGILHAEMRQKIRGFGLADAFMLATARKLGAKIVTGDPHFKGIKEAEMV